MSNHRNLSLVAAAVAFGFPLTASAQQTAYTTAPVNVGACEVSSIDERIGGPGYFTLDLPQRNLHLSFTNTGRVPATKVSFIVNDGTSHQIDDRGTFSPGAVIDREIRDTAASEGSAHRRAVRRRQLVARHEREPRESFALDNSLLLV